jgi:hypothetical protein
VVGVDMTEEQLHKADRLRDQHGLTQTSFRFGHIEQLDLDAGSFDAGEGASSGMREDDAGTALEPSSVEFTPRGCSAAGAELATVLLGLLLASGRRSS